MIKTAIITTTINVPIFLDKILKNILKEKKNNEIVTIVIGDKKTPNETGIYCKKISKKFNTVIKYFDVKAQDKFFKKYLSLYKMFPYNDAVRKLLGSIYTKIVYRKSIERIIFIDDDNYLTDDKSFLNGHNITNSKITGTSIKAKNNWVNIYENLVVEHNVPIFPRGYPWKYRGCENKLSFKKFKNKKIIAKCGFITGDPDIDAVSRLFWPIYVKKVKSKKNYYFTPGTFTPFNDQNTSISREYIMLYYKPLSAGRNSDIWTSYLICKMAEIYREIVSYGSPVLKQIRNKHDYWKDYDLEVEHNISTDYFADLINKIKLKKQKTKYLTLKLLCKKILVEISSSEKKINFIKMKARHYQGFSKNERSIRSSKSLKYIRAYFQEYLLWLKNIKKYDLI